MNEWCKFIDIISKYIVIYNFFQNNVIERKIKIIENQIQVMLQNVELSIKFWLEIEKVNIYVRNHIIINSMINKKEINFIKVFIEVQSFIDYLRVWKYKCYIFVNIKFLFDDNKTDKLIHKDKSYVFFNYNKNINTQN